MTVSGVAAATAVALLVPAMQATSSDEVAADRSNAPSARAADLRAEATLAGAPLGAASGRPNAPFPPDDDTQAMVLDGLKGGEYVAAQTGVIEEAPEPAQVAESEPEPEPEPTATAEPEPEPEPTATAEPEPEPEPESTQQETTASSSGGGHTSPDGQYTYEHSIDTWERLAQCESNGDWSINTGNGYYGGIQFSKSSWDSVGGSGYPHENSKWEQIHRGELLHDRQGWGAWPECSRKLGLR